jgi:hypothetical protein
MRHTLEPVLIFQTEAAKAHMRPYIAFIFACSAALASSIKPVWAQDLSPRAYVITPLHSNAIIMSYSFYHGMSSSMERLRSREQQGLTACRFLATIILSACWAVRPT